MTDLETLAIVGGLIAAVASILAVVFSRRYTGRGPQLLTDFTPRIKKDLTSARKQIDILTSEPERFFISNFHDVLQSLARSSNLHVRIILAPTLGPAGESLNQLQSMTEALKSSDESIGTRVDVKVSPNVSPMRIFRVDKAVYVSMYSSEL